MVQLISTNQLTTGKTILVHGPTGSGKTRLIATAPNPVIAATDRGCASLKQFNLPMEAITSIKKMREFLTWARSPQGQQFQTICIDDMTELAEIALLEARGRTNHLQKAYGEMMDVTYEFIRELRDWPNKNQYIYMACKQSREKDHATGQFIYTPDFPGQKLGMRVSYFFDEVYALFSGTDENSGQFTNWFRTRRDNQYECKTRGDSLEVWEPANLSHIYTKLG